LGNLSLLLRSAEGDYKSSDWDISNLRLSDVTQRKIFMLKQSSSMPKDAKSRDELIELLSKMKEIFSTACVFDGLGLFAVCNGECDCGSLTSCADGVERSAATRAA